MSAQPIDLWQLAWSTGFVVLAGLVSLALRLGLEGRLLVASLRTVAQLLAVGYVLSWVFSLRSPLYVGALVTVMIAAAAWAAVSRSSRRFRGARLGAFAEAVETYARFERACSEKGLATFDDYIMLPIRILRESPEAAAIIRDETRHVVVDEYQDVNGAQLELLRLLAPPSPERHVE